MSKVRNPKLKVSLGPMTPPVPVRSSTRPNLTERFKQLVDDLAVVTQGQVDKARGILKELVGGSILLHPTDDGEARYLTAELAGDYAGLVRLAVPNIKVVAVTRIERVTRGL